MNVDFINPFVVSIAEILNTMASMTVEQQKPFLKHGEQPLGPVSAIIPMRGDTVHGSLAISFSDSAILKIASNMLGEEVTELDDTCHNLTGEITNMLSGGARKRLWEKGYNFDMAQPDLLDASQPLVHHAKSPVVVIPFTTCAGDFYIEVALAENFSRAELSLS